MTPSRVRRRAAFVSTAFAGLAAAGAGAVANAQIADPIAECRETTRGKSDRIACLETAIRALMAAGPVAAEAASSADAASTATVAQTPDAANMADAAAAAKPEDAATPSGLGAEQVAARNRNDRASDKRDARETLTATLSDFAVSRSGAYVFFLDNGQIWRQKPSDANRARLSNRRDYAAEVSKGALSGYRLRLNGVRRPFLVERIK